jgi:hypothetical protein
MTNPVSISPGVVLKIHRRVQSSPNFLSLHQITASGLTRIGFDVQFLQSFESNNQNSRSLFHSIGLFDFRLYMLGCCLSARIRIHPSPSNHMKASKLSDYTTTTMSRSFMSKAWSPKT